MLKASQGVDARFTPVAPPRLPDNASSFALLRALLRNPLEAWPNRAFAERVYRYRVFGRNCVHVADPTTIMEVLHKESEAFPKDEIEEQILKVALGDGLFAAQGERWERQRKAMSPAFRNDNLLALVPVFAKAGEEMAQRLAAGDGEVDITIEATKAAFDVIYEATVSSEAMQASEVIRNSELVLDQAGRLSLLDILGLSSLVLRRNSLAVRKAVGALRAAASAAIQQRLRKVPASGDLLHLLLASRKQPSNPGGLDDIELRDNVLTLIGAGHQTSANALTWALYLLANAPEWQELLHKEAVAVTGAGPVLAEHIEQLKLHEQVINEAMRLYPPAAVINRVASRDLALSNVQIKKGDLIVISFFALHRHETLWDQPNLFDPRRFSPAQSASRPKHAFIPFSGGPRICIGARFATIELVALLATLMRTLKFEPTDQIPRPISRITLHPAEGLRLKIRSRPDSPMMDRCHDEA